MAPLRLPFIAAACAAFAGVAIASAEETEVQWPENGAIKLGVPKSPPNLTIDIPGCFTIQLDWANDSVTLQMSGGKAVNLVGSERMRSDGGQLVALMNRENGQVHVITYVEASDGSFDSRMVSPKTEQCALSKIRVSSPTPEQLKDVTVGVSAEIEQLYREAMGFNAVEGETQ
ncbi:hypothetical protein Emag_006401 [Eimeria magna]